MTRVRIATRGSDLALAQARFVATRIESAIGAETELVVVKTRGDRLQDVSLAKLGGKGLFVKEIEETLLEGRADVAVHSAKDLPAVLAPGLDLVAFPERRDPRDALIGRSDAASVAGLSTGARVGTGSARRRAALLAQRPDLEIVPLRGNVPTRLAKLESESLDAVILACAGLERLGLGDRIHERIASEIVLPAVCQGTLALQARENDRLALQLRVLDDRDTALAVAAERGFLIRLEGDCTVPLAAFAELLPQGRLRLRGWLAASDGSQVASAEAEGAARDAKLIAADVADRVLAQGGREILDELAAEASS